MRCMLFLLAALTHLAGIALFSQAKSALHEVEGYQHHEIARLLHCSIGNSKSQLHTAKLKMRDLLFPKRRSARRRVAECPSGETAPVRAKNNRGTEVDISFDAVASKP